MWSAYARLFRYVGPFIGLLIGAIVLMVVSAGLDAFTLVLLIPFLQSLFGAEILGGAGTSRLEGLLAEKAVLESRLEEQHGRDAADVVAAVVDGAVDLSGGGRLASGSVELPAGSDAGAFGDLLRELDYEA